MGRRGSLGGVASLWVVLLAPGAAAWSVEGSLLVETGAHFPAGSRLAMHPDLVFAGNVTDGIRVEVEAARVNVHVYEKTYVSVPPLVRGERAFREASWTLTGASVAVAGAADARAFLALEGACADDAFVPAATSTVEHRTSTVTSSADVLRVAPGGSSPRATSYWRERTGDHVFVEAPGAFTGRCAGTLRVQGLDLTLRAAENETRIATGSRETGTGESVERWVYLAFDRADLRIASPDAPVRLLSASVEAIAWSGPAHLRALDGQLRTAHADYASVGAARLAGDLTASILPVPGDARLLRLAAIRGDLASTTLAEHPRPAPPAPGPAVPWAGAAVLLLAAVAAGGAAGGLAAWRPRPRRAPPTREDQHAWCLAWASWFEEQEDAAAALECLRCARGFVDEADHDHLLWEGACLDRLGHLEDALAAFEAAVAVAPRGECEAAFSAAIVAGQLAREEPALLNLRLALMADPFLVEVVDALAESDDDPFAPLRARPEFRKLLREARAWGRTAGAK